MKKQIKKQNKVTQWFKCHLKVIGLVLSYVCVVGLVIGLFIWTNTLRTQLSESEESNNILRKTNLNLTDKNTKCDKDLVTLSEAGYLVGNWKQRTEEIMWKVDELFAEYSKNEQKYCMIYDSERPYWKYENDRILNEYYDVVDTYKQLLSEQK